MTDTPTRISRTDSQARTREQLLAAAAALFAERGFDGTSVDQIARRAGYTSGALYSNFASKEELFLALLTERRSSRAERHQTAIDQLDANADDRDESLTDLFCRVVDRRNRTAVLQAEFWLFAVRHPEALDATARQWRAQREATARYFDRGSDPLPDEIRDEVATVAVALFQGLVHARRLDPASVPDDLFARAMNWVRTGVRAVS